MTWDAIRGYRTLWPYQRCIASQRVGLVLQGMLLGLLSDAKCSCGNAGVSCKTRAMQCAVLLGTLQKVIAELHERWHNALIVHTLWWRR